MWSYYWVFWNWRVISLYLFSFQLLFQKKKNMLVEFCTFCSQEYCKIIKFHSVRWLGLFTCIERTLKLYPSLKSYICLRSWKWKMVRKNWLVWKDWLNNLKMKCKKYIWTFSIEHYQSLSNSIYYYNEVIQSFTWCMMLYLIHW